MGRAAPAVQKARVPVPGLDSSKTLGYPKNDSKWLGRSGFPGLRRDSLHTHLSAEGAGNAQGELMGTQPASCHTQPDPCPLGMSCLLRLSSHDVKLVLTEEDMGKQHPTEQSPVAPYKQPALSKSWVL